MTPIIELVRSADLIRPIGERDSSYRPGEPSSWILAGNSYSFNAADIAKREKNSLIKVKTDSGPAFFRIVGNYTEGEDITTPMVERLMPKKAEEMMKELNIKPDDVELVRGVPQVEPYIL